MARRSTRPWPAAVHGAGPLRAGDAEAERERAGDGAGERRSCRSRPSTRNTAPRPSIGAGSRPTQPAKENARRAGDGEQADVRAEDGAG